MVPVNARQRLAALTVVGLLALGGTVAAVALRAGPPESALPAATPPATMEAVRRATSLSDAFVAIAAAVMPAVVRIQVERTAAAETSGATGTLQDQFGRPRERAPRDPAPAIGGGSGFLVSGDGYILTNHHVVAGADRITVVLRDKRTLPAAVVGADPLTDVAVIRVQATGLPAVALGNSDAARVGEWVLAIGNPGFANASTLDFTVTGGIISAKGRPLNILRTDVPSSSPSYAIEDFIQTDAVINPGNSGGPLVDLQGTVIGINTAIASTTGYSQGYGFAIPSNLAQRVMRDLIAHGYVRRPLLGISIADVTPEDAEVYRLDRIVGVVVEDFAPESPAQRSGLRQHDVIVAVDGTPIEQVGQLQRLVALHQPDETVRLSVVRYGDSLDVRVRLVEADGSRPPQATAAPAPAASGVGLELEELTPARARQLGFERAGGALVAGVVAGSAADRKNIGVDHRLSSIDGRAIGSVAEARAALRRARSGQILSMVLEFPGGRTYIANVRVP